MQVLGQAFSEPAMLRCTIMQVLGLAFFLAVAIRRVCTTLHDLRAPLIRELSTLLPRPKGQYLNLMKRAPGPTSGANFVRSLKEQGGKGIRV